MMFPGSGLYAITQTDHKSDVQVLTEVEQAIKGGAVVIQYRDKNRARHPELAEKILWLCREYTIPLLINDDIDLAATIGADGVHLGKYDGDIDNARHHLGKQAIIGVSCYNDLPLAIAAEQQGATYVAFGRFFPSSSKPLASPAQLETLQQARAVLTLPIVAIGGILPENGASLLAAGADVLAVIGGVFSNQPEQAARAYQPLFV